jgi:nitroimidazol reductase NimA-like FMN-containing flavoprotein (pyridoxamine 5'-phosphate oxidase superfamily)
MKLDDPAVRAVMRRAMVARVATLSREGRPSITPIYFVYVEGRIWIGTVDWTLAARNATADPRVSVLLEPERDPSERRVLRITGRATVRTDKQAQLSYNVRVARKYILTPGGIRNYLTHIRQLRAMHSYHAQSAARGRPCVIEVIPEQAEFIDGRRD